MVDVGAEAVVDWLGHEDERAEVGKAGVDDEVMIIIISFFHHQLGFLHCALMSQ